MTAYSDPDRYGCTLGRKAVTYATLSREYVCNECGGRIVVKWSDDEGHYPECGRCGGRDFIHHAEWERQKAEAVEVLDGLPAEFAAALGFTKRPKCSEIYPLCPEQVEL